jgi:DNA-binding IscR family transcriptional regulator
MKVTARERTALRAVLDLARRYGSGVPTFLSEVVRAQELSLPYLEQGVGFLRRPQRVASGHGTP